ncbi:hypothetical protein KY284_025636 [Solanum tuberosum]|nr:hypothetical protein KY284_025636 [Solanum tuberosum]
MKNWETTLIGYVVGDTPYGKQMENCVEKNWSFVPMPRFPGLPVGYWSIEALSKVASAVGRPLYTDQYTANVVKISYAKILIEVDVSQLLTEVIQIETTIGLWEQQVDSEWKPKYCNESLGYGHTDLECWYLKHGKGKNDTRGTREQPTIQQKGNKAKKPRASKQDNGVNGSIVERNDTHAKAPESNYEKDIIIQRDGKQVLTDSDLGVLCTNSAGNSMPFAQP